MHDVVTTFGTQLKFVSKQTPEKRGELTLQYRLLMF